jgi:hypothetical protein
MWFAFRLLMAIWLLLKFVLHKGGYIHMILVAAISIAVVELIAERKNRYHRASDS